MNKRATRKKINDFFRRFVFHLLNIDTIPHEEFYSLAWMADLLLLVYALSQIMNNRRGGYVACAFICFFGLVVLVWVGKMYGSKRGKVAAIGEMIAVMAFLSRHNLEKLGKFDVDASNVEALSRFLNAWLDGWGK